MSTSSLPFASRPTLPWDTVRDLIRLICEAYELGDDADARRSHLREGLAALTRELSAESGALLDVFHAGAGHLLEGSAARGGGAVYDGLSSRQRATLDCLLRGMSEKEAALHLGLSPHTVHVYVKALHRAFAVRSRAELISRCLRRR